MFGSLHQDTVAWPDDEGRLKVTAAPVASRPNRRARGCPARGRRIRAASLETCRPDQESTARPADRYLDRRIRTGAELQSNRRNRSPRTGARRGGEPCKTCSQESATKSAQTVSSAPPRIVTLHPACDRRRLRIQGDAPVARFHAQLAQRGPDRSYQLLPQVRAGIQPTSL